MKKGFEDDITSEFEPDSDVEAAKRRRFDLAQKPDVERFKKPKRSAFFKEESNEERKRSKVLQLDAYSRHKKLINDYLLCYSGTTKLLKRDESRDRTDLDVVRQNLKFVWDEEQGVDSWERRLAKKYYDKLFKEYCIADLSRYRENAIALRWRVEKEVITGKGQFVCGNKRCASGKALTSWEVNFGYVEEGIKKNTLVKLRLCPDCSAKLNYRHRKKKAEKKPKKRTKSADKSIPDGEAGTSTVHVKSEGNEPKDDQVSEEQEIKATEKAEVEAKELWSKPLDTEEDKSREDEFEEFLEDMLL